MFLPPRLRPPAKRKKANFSEIMRIKAVSQRIKIASKRFATLPRRAGAPVLRCGLLPSHPKNKAGKCGPKRTICRFLPHFCTHFATYVRFSRAGRTAVKAAGSLVPFLPSVPCGEDFTCGTQSAIENPQSAILNMPSSSHPGWDKDCPTPSEYHLNRYSAKVYRLTPFSRFCHNANHEK